MVFGIRRRKTKEPALRSIENKKAIVEREASPRISAKGVQNAAQHSAASSIRSMFKKTNKKKKGKNGKKFKAGLIQTDSLYVRAKSSPKDDDSGSSSSPADHTGKTILSPRPPLPPSTVQDMPPSTVQHLRYRNAYNSPPADEESAKGSVVSGDSMYRLMMQELKRDFSSSERQPLRFVPAQTVVRSNKTKPGKEYQEEIDTTLRVLDEGPGYNNEIESRDSPTQRGPPNETAEMRDDFIGPHDPNMVDDAIQMNLIYSSDGDSENNVKTVGPLRYASEHDRQAFEAQLDCTSDDPCDRSVRSSKSARSSMSARSGRSARSSRSVRSGRSAGSRSIRDSELVSLRELRGKRRHRKRKDEVEPSSSSSDDGSDYTEGRVQSLRKLSKRDRVPVDGRSHYSEASGTFDETTLGDTEYEWDKIDSFDSWLSLENELRYGAKDDWFCGICLR